MLGYFDWNDDDSYASPLDLNKWPDFLSLDEIKSKLLNINNIIKCLNDDPNSH